MDLTDTHDVENFKQTLLALVSCQDEIMTCLDCIHPHMSDSFKECYNHFLHSSNINLPVETFRIKLEYIFTYLHDHLNIGKWSEVPAFKRQAFSAVCFLKAVRSIQNNTLSDLKTSLNCIDKGFLMGLPLSGNCTLLTDSAKLISSRIQSMEENTISSLNLDINNSNCGKRKRDDYESYSNLNGIEIGTLVQPSIEEFCKKHFTMRLPAKLKDCMTHWPAMNKWTDINYLLSVAGERTVPIEIGSYSAENFSQKLMTITDYIKTHYFGGVKEKEVGYLAQHDLLTQVPELKEDICIPEYCCISRKDDPSEDEAEPEICAWFGPRNTVSSLHYDPKDNLLCQVYGTKQVILFDPSDSEYLYPHPEFLLTNTARVDPVLPDLNAYPDFTHAKMYKCLLCTGDMLYIPPKWWHHVTALEKSFSINFWWE